MITKDSFINYFISGIKDNSEDYFIVCKKQTCSPKLKNLEELENYFKNL